MNKILNSLSLFDFPSPSQSPCSPRYICLFFKCLGRWLQSPGISRGSSMRRSWTLQACPSCKVWKKAKDIFYCIAQFPAWSHPEAQQTERSTRWSTSGGQHVEEGEKETRTWADTKKADLRLRLVTCFVLWESDHQKYKRKGTHPFFRYSHSAAVAAERDACCVDGRETSWQLIWVKRPSPLSVWEQRRPEAEEVSRKAVGSQGRSLQSSHQDRRSEDASFSLDGFCSWFEQNCQFRFEKRNNFRFNWSF